MKDAYAGQTVTDVQTSIKDKPYLPASPDQGLANEFRLFQHVLTGIEWLLIAGILLVLFVPLAGKMLGWPPSLDLNENRQLVNRPSLIQTPLNQLPGAIDKWWNDRFAFRTHLISIHEMLWLHILNAPGKKHILGKDGHLFLNLMKGEAFHSAQNTTVLDYMGLNRLTSQQLTDWMDYLPGKNAWLKAYGVHYLFVVAPNKITVQERFLPDLVREAKGSSYWMQLKKQVISRLDQEIDILDLTDVLISRETESGTLMFSKTDDITHWNGAGYYEGLVAMDSRLRQVFPNMPPFPGEKFQMTRKETDPTSFFCQWENDLTVNGVEETIIKKRPGDWRDSRCSTASGRNDNLVLFSDSSWKAVAGGLHHYFPGGHTAFPYQWGRHRHAVIEGHIFEELRQIVREEQPDVIVEAQTERALGIIGLPFEFRQAARFSRGQPILHLGPKECMGIDADSIDKIDIDGDSFAFNAATSDPKLKIPVAIRRSEKNACILMIDLDVPEKDTFQVFWAVNGAFRENDSVRIAVLAGRNVLFLPIGMNADEDNFLRIDPGSAEGRYRIRKIEVRLTPADNTDLFG